MCEVAAGAKEIYCYGPAKVDCDKIAVLGANVFAALESALGPLNNMPLLEKKFHIQNFLFWSIMGTILTWIGFLMALYAEIKAILIVSLHAAELWRFMQYSITLGFMLLTSFSQLRERDERERLVTAKIVKENPVKIKELLDQENSYFIVRPYVTILAYLIFWAGMLLQFTPMCSFITLIFPFWFGVESKCRPSSRISNHAASEIGFAGVGFLNARNKSLSVPGGTSKDRARGTAQMRATWWCWRRPSSSLQASSSCCSA